MSEKTFGCRFALSIMSDRFIDIILGSLAKTDTSRIEASTGRLSTLYRGDREQVLDAVEGCFTHAFTEGVHMTMEATFSTDDGACRTGEAGLPNTAARDIHFPCNAKMALYTMKADPAEATRFARDCAVKHGVFVKDDYYCTVLSGDIQDVFRTTEEICAYAERALDRFAFELTVSVNSPTAE